MPQGRGGGKRAGLRRDYPRAAAGRQRTLLPSQARGLAKAWFSPMGLLQNTCPRDFPAQMAGSHL